MGLLPRVIIAIILGIGAGMVLPAGVVRVFVTFNGLFSEFLGFMIPLIILGLVAPAIAEIGRGAGRMLVATAALAYAATLFAGFFSYGACEAALPSIITPGAVAGDFGSSSTAPPFFTIEIPAPMSVMTALVAAFVAGLGMAGLKSEALRDVFFDFREIIMKVIQAVIIPCLPIYIFGIFLSMTQAGEVASVLAVFVKVIVVIFALHIALLLLQYAVAGLITRRNPLRLLWNMLPAYFTALGTSSSAATIPVTLRQTVSNGVRGHIAGFVVPLCATIHLSGSTLKIVACALALMMAQGGEADFGVMAGFICMLGVTMVAAPGVPGGAIMAALAPLESILGFGAGDQALMIALYIAMDSFGTACNVTGDGALALIIDRWFGRGVSG